MQLLSREEVDPIYREPFILKGYRHPGTSSFQCLKYALVLHNDVGNFWTHFIPFVIWVIWLVVLFFTWEDFIQPYYYPILCFWAGSCSYALLSSIAHLFSSMSFTVRTVCFILDYLGISLYALGGGIAALFYLIPLSSSIYSYRTVLLGVEVSVCVCSTLLAGLSRFFWRNYRFTIRALSYVPPYICATGPYFHRLWRCWQHGEDCVPETMKWHFLSIFFTFVLTFFFVTKIPERFMPGKFDTFFQSHQLFHLSAVMLTSIQMHMLPMEAVLRKTVLTQVIGYMPTWKTTFLPWFCALVLGLVVVGELGNMTRTGALTTNKLRRKLS